MSARDPLHKWKVTGLIATLVIGLVIPVYTIKELRLRAARPPEIAAEATFVGRDQCIGCHEGAYASWLGSDHDRAMDVATDSTVVGDFDNAEFAYGDIAARFFRKDGRFFVHTAGPDGVPADFEIEYTFGFEPLQQYLVPFPGGRLQCLTIAWDTERNEWFYLYPGHDIPPNDWLHWTQGAQTWNTMCAECHSTNLVKNFDPQSNTFNTTWSEIDVSCEACHGPGSRHVEWAEIPPMARPDVENYALTVQTSDISSRQQVELCAPCHSRRMELGNCDHHQAELMDVVVPTVLEQGLYYPDGQILEEVYVYGSFVQSKMYRNDVRCSDCHDVHSLKLHAEGNALCTRCHQADVYDSYDHHFHKQEYEGKLSDGALCVSCHMPERPYMVVDWRADHSIRIPRPDLSLEIGVPNACSQQGCHADKPVEWAAEYYEKWYGQARKPHFGTAIAAGRAHEPGARDQLIRLAGDRLYPAIARATALDLLSSYPGDDVRAAFRVALTDEEALIRHTAVTNFNGTSPEDLVANVAPLLFDNARAVRMQASVRLAGLPDTLFKPYQQEALDESLAEYRTAMSYSLDFPFAGFNLANLSVSLQENEQAESYYQRAIEIDDLFYPAKVNLAMLYNSEGHNDEAERLLRQVVEQYPDQYDAAYSLGLLLVEMGNPEAAAEYLQRAADGLPDRTRIRYNLGLLEQQLGHPAKAEAALVPIVEIEPNNIEYLYALADFYIKQQQYAKALPVAEQMIATHPDQKIGHDIKAFVEKGMR